MLTIGPHTLRNCSLEQRLNDSLPETAKTYFAAYRAIKPAMKGSAMKATPAIASGIFSWSVILSVFLK